jgi:two-component system sensor histidine kinase KdpD
VRVHLVRAAAAAGLIGGMTAVVWLLRPLAPDITLGALYVVVVLVAALLWGLGWAIGVSVVSLLAFNFFVLPPVHTFALEDASNWTALLVYLVTATVTSELAARLRRRAAEATRREREAALLADLAARLLAREDLGELADRIEPGDGAAGARLAQAVASLHALAADRERLEAEAVEAEALRRTDAVKTAVIQSVSHDLRTPLATIEAALDGLESEALELDDAGRRELLATLRHELVRLERFVENMLDLSRLQAGAATPSTALWPIDELAAQALDELAEAERMRVRVRVPAALPPVRCDAVQLQRALVNLLENALKFSPPGSEVTLRADVRDGSVELRVEDAGPGVGADAATIFEPFRHAAGSGGAGLGLAIARGFVEANGGTIGVETAAAGGAAFVVVLPAEQAAPVVS